MERTHGIEPMVHAASVRMVHPRPIPYIISFEPFRPFPLQRNIAQGITFLIGIDAEREEMICGG
jgi:hypothetical protein